MVNSTHIQTELASLSGLIDSIHACTKEPAKWERVIQSIAEWVGAAKAIIFTPLHPQHQGGFYCSYGISHEHIELWQTHYRNQDPWHSAAIQSNSYQEGNVLNGDEHVSHCELIKSNFYQEYLAPQKIAHSLTGVIYGMDSLCGKPAVILTLYRGENEGAFSCEENKQVAMLLPHLTHALLAMCHLREMESVVQSNFAAMNQLRVGVLLINKHSHVVFANRSARKQIAAHSGISLGIKHGEACESMTFADHHVAQNVQAAIQEAFIANTSSTASFSRSITPPAIENCHTYTLNLFSLNRQNKYDIATSAASVIIFITSGRKSLSFDLASLKRIYGLTNAEVKAIQIMAECCTLEETAKTLAVSVNTLKSQLKAIYAKTHVSSGVQLMKLIFSSTRQID
ncbi:MAG: hypothetical protein HOO95_04960 [Gallionella sp.]|nr:hypothetical protein [Gallionella sp.]